MLVRALGGTRKVPCHDPKYDDILLMTPNVLKFLQVGDPGRAGPMFERALADLEAALGPNHPDVAHAAIDLGVLRLEQVTLPATSFQLLTFYFRHVWGAGPTEARSFGHPPWACCIWSR